MVATVMRVVSWSSADCKCVDCIPSCSGRCECLEMIDFEREYHVK